MSRGCCIPTSSSPGDFERVESAVDLESVMREIDDARLEEAARQFRVQERE
jgi:hypothetical protein